MGLRHGTATRIDQVDTGKQAPAQVRVRRIDTGIEERDRHSGAVEAGNLQAPHRRRRDIQRFGNLRGERGPNRIDSRNLAVAGHESERGRIEARRESVQHAHVAIVGRHASSRGRHPGKKLLLYPDRGPGPPAHLRLRRLTAEHTDASGERGLLEQHDVALRS